METEIATKFKDTDIGLIPEEWEFDSLDNHADVLMGQSPESKFYNNIEGTPFLQGIRTFGEKYPTYDTYTTKVTKLAPGGSVLLSVRAPVGEVNIADRDVCIGRGLMSINSKNNEFIYQLFKAFKDYVVGKETGTVYGSVTREVIAKLKFPFPPQAEQDKISEILSSIDNKIELNRKINFNLEKLGSFLFKEWFIDVDNQQIGKVSDLIRVESGFPFHSSMFDENGDYKLVTIKNVQDGFFVPECTDSLSEIPSKVPTHCRLNNGDILLSLTGNVGRVCFVYGENYLLNQRVANLVPIDENNRAFTYFLFRQKDFQNTLIGISRGTAQQNLSPIETKSLEIPIPSQDMLDRFADVANPIFQKLVENYNEIKNLSTLRDSLLPRLMNGKIRVK
jgi:type I restriction enzyme S subunit